MLDKIPKSHIGKDCVEGNKKIIFERNFKEVALVKEVGYSILNMSIESKGKPINRVPLGQNNKIPIVRSSKFKVDNSRKLQQPTGGK